jgi:type I restriction enzyme R subunit
VPKYSKTIPDGPPVHIGSLAASQERFKVCCMIDGQHDVNKPQALELEVLTKGVFERQRFLDRLQHLSS